MNLQNIFFDVKNVVTMDNDVNRNNGIVKCRYTKAIKAIYI